jgi:hypothetical protein
MAKRDTPTPSMTMEEASAELAKIEAEDEALRAQLLAITRRRDELSTRRREIEPVLVRARVEASLGEFVAIRGDLWRARRLEPKAGDVGRLLKIGRTRALIDFGDRLRTWYVPLEAVGEVRDPFADERRDDEDHSNARC